MENLSFADAAALYMKNITQENGPNIPIKKQQLQQELIPYFSDTPLSRIRRFEIETFKDHMLGKGFAKATINRYIAGEEWGWIDKMPVIIKYREDNIKTRYLSADEIQSLLAAAEADKCPVIAPFIHIALGTAMRRMEILSIRIDNINCENREIFIPKAKTGARMQPMTATLARYLEDYLRTKIQPEQIFLFPAESSTGHRMEIEKPFYRVVTAAGLDRYEVTRHTLRHTAITHLVQAGVDLPTVQRFSGHRSLAMVFRYSHQSREHLNKSLDQLDAKLNLP